LILGISQTSSSLFEHPKMTNKVPDKMAEQVITEDVFKTSFTHETAATLGTKQELSLKVRVAFKYYWRAAMWSVLIGLLTVMESYDLQIVNSFYAFPQFQKRFGVPVGAGFQIPAKWQLGISLGAHVGLIGGVFLNGYLSDKLGHRKTLMGALVWLSGGIFIMFFATSIEMIFAAELIWSVCRRGGEAKYRQADISNSSLPFGLFAAATPTYAAEICPLILRGYLTTYMNLCWVYT
jgi:SP family general alpha glucoside:H+ symporter-like MFS transporter